MGKPESQCLDLYSHLHLGSQSHSHSHSHSNLDSHSEIVTIWIFVSLQFYCTHWMHSERWDMVKVSRNSVGKQKIYLRAVCPQPPVRFPPNPAVAAAAVTNDYNSQQNELHVSYRSSIILHGLKICYHFQSVKSLLVCALCGFFSSVWNSLYCSVFVSSVEPKPMEMKMHKLDSMHSLGTTIAGATISSVRFHSYRVKRCANASRKCESHLNHIRHVTWYDTLS